MFVLGWLDIRRRVCFLNNALHFQFASSAKKIQNTPVVNEIVDNTTLLCRHHKEIEALRSQIEVPPFGFSWIPRLLLFNLCFYVLLSKSKAFFSNILFWKGGGEMEGG